MYMSSSRTREGSSSARQNSMLARLERSIVGNRPATVKQCIDDGADVNENTPNSGLRPLELALELRNLSMMRMLLDRKADSERKSNNGSTVLIKACRIGYLDGVKLLVERGANLNIQCDDGTTCLLVALDFGHPSIVAYLLEQNSCKVKDCGRDGLCLLQRLVLADGAKLISNLKKKRVDLNKRNPDGTVAVFFATKNCKNNALKALLEAGANPNIGTKDGHFALHEAMEQNNADAVKHLMKHGADTRIVDKGGLTPIDVALKKKCLPMLRLLLECGANIEQKCTCGSTPLLAACSMGYVEGVQLLVERGASMKARSSNRLTCLHNALEYGHQSIGAYLLKQQFREVGARGRDGCCLLQYLVSTNDALLISTLKGKGVDFNTRCPDGTVAVFFAAKHCKNKALKELLEAGADPNIGTVAEDFALHEAIDRNNVDAVTQLLAYDADTRILNKDGLTPVHVAIKERNLPVLKLLIEQGVDLEQNCALGLTPLVAACSVGCMECVKLLVERGVNLRARSANGMTCLDVALEIQYRSMIAYLLKQDSCTTNVRGEDGLCLLQHLVLLDDAPLICNLKDIGIDFNARCPDGTTAVLFATKHRKDNSLRGLLEAGADPNVATIDRDTALREAVVHGNVEAVKLLLEGGADRTMLDKNRMTPAEVAEALVPAFQDIIRRLRTNCGVEQETGAFDRAGTPVDEKKNIPDDELEQSLCCPITFDIMKDPVIAMDGHTYEREAIEQWIREKRESPVTRQPMTSATLIPNLSIKHLIDKFADMDSNP